MVVDCHHSLRLCGDIMKMSLPKIIFLGRLPLLPGSHLGQNFGPYGNCFVLVNFFLGGGGGGGGGGEPPLLPGSHIGEILATRVTVSSESPL